MFRPIVHAAQNPLLSLLLRLSPFYILVFTLPMLLIHSQPTITSDLQTLFMPSSDCALPCFQGVSPGVTTVDEGLKRLRASALIASISPVSSVPSSPAPADVYDVQFSPTFATMRSAQMQITTQAHTGIIQSIYLSQTGLLLRDLLLTFGPPAQAVLDNPLHLGLATYAAFYPHDQLYVQVVLAVCPHGATTLENIRQDVLIGIGSASAYAAQATYYQTKPTANNEGWLQQLHDMRRTSCL